VSGRRVSQILATSAVAILLVSACGGGSQTETATSSPDTATVSPTVADTEPLSTDPPAKTDAPTETEVEPTVTEPPAATTPEPAPPAAPASGQSLVVVGVSIGDVLNFRAEPDPAAAIVDHEAPATELRPRTITATGSSAWHGTESWWEVELGGANTWANARYLAAEGETYDLGYFLRGLGTYHDDDDRGREDDVGLGDFGLIERVAQKRFPEGYRSVVELNSFGDDAQTGQVWIDIFADGDDATRGERVYLIVRFVIDPDIPESIGLEVIEAEGTVLCSPLPDELGACESRAEAAGPHCQASIHMEESCEANGGEFDTRICECVDADAA